MCSFFANPNPSAAGALFAESPPRSEKTRETTRPEDVTVLSSAPPSSRLRNVFRNGAAENPGEHVWILRLSLRLLVVASKELELDQTVQFPKDPQRCFPQPRLQA